MKLSDVKIGMRVAIFCNDGVNTGFGAVVALCKYSIKVEVRDDDGFLYYWNPVNLRKVKPRKSVRFEADVAPYPFGNAFGTIGSLLELAPFIGKKVIVTVREKK